MIRKRWLIATVISYLFPFMTMSIAQVAVMSNAGISTAGMGLALLMAFAVMGLAIWVFYHCASRRYGTKYLTFTLVTGPIIILVFALLALTNSSPRIAGVAATSLTSSVFVFITSLISIGIYVWWYILSLKLRARNKKVRREVYEALQASSLPREYLSAFAP